MKKIRKLLAFAVILCVIFAFTACGDNSKPSSSDAADSQQSDDAGSIAKTYHFEYTDEYGDTSRFSIKLRTDCSFTVMTSVGSLGDNVCNGTQWQDNGDGTFTTGASDNILALDFVEKDGSIVWNILDDDGNVAPVGYIAPIVFLEKPIEPDENDTIAESGVYTYVESGLAPFDIIWTLTLNEDGTYILTEENERVGLLEYDGLSYTIDGSKVTCGPMGENRPDMFTWSDPEGFSVTTGSTAFAPEGVTLGEEPMTAVPAAKSNVFAYVESGLAPFDIIWTLTLNEDGTYILSEENERAGLLEYDGLSYTIDGSKVTCGPMGENKPDMFTWSDPAGFAVELDGKNFKPVE